MGSRTARIFKAVGKEREGGDWGRICFWRVVAVAEDSHLTLDVGVCLRASCPPNQCQKPFPAINVRITLGLA